MLTQAQAQLATLTGQTAALETQGRQSTGPTWGMGGGGGGTCAFICQSIPAIGGGGSGTGDVYQLTGGSQALFATGATIWNPYASATTAGRRCTLAQNPDGSFLVYGQSCT
jgi:hypothetical protein